MHYFPNLLLYNENFSINYNSHRKIKQMRDYQSFLHKYLHVVYDSQQLKTQAEKETKIRDYQCFLHKS